jgi:2-furoyl-CoA dehydrogenase FAD binding subunit
VETLAAHPGAKVLAGGQSLVPLLSMRLATPEMLVDINGLGDLDRVEVTGDGVRVGALARHAAVLADDRARTTQPLLALALGHVAHATIRNRGTVVGSIVHADPSAEVPVVLALLEGRLDVVSTRGRRTIPAADLFVGPMEAALRHDELAVEAFFPALEPRTGVAIDEVARRQGDYALCGVAATVTLDEGGGIRTARASYLSVCEVPTVVDLTPLLAGGLSDTALAEAAELALEQLDPGADIHATAAYRRQLVRTLTRRVVTAAHPDAVARTGDNRRRTA